MTVTTFAVAKQLFEPLSVVRFGSIAEITLLPRHARSSPQSRHSSARVQVTKSGPLLRGVIAPKVA